MKLIKKNYIASVVATTYLVLVCSSQISLARPQAGNIISRGVGGLAGATAGAAAGANAGSEALANANANASATRGNSNGGGGINASSSANVGSSSNESSSQLSGSASADAKVSSNGGSQQEASSSASVSIGSSTPKPDGLIGKMKDMFKEGKEMLKNTVDNSVKDERKVSAESSASTAGNGSSGSAQASAQSSSSAQSVGSAASAQASVSVGSSTPKPEGLLEKVSEFAKKGKEAIKEVVEPKKEEKSFRDDKSQVRKEEKDVTINKDGRKVEERKEEVREDVGEKKEGPIDKVQKLVSKGTEVVRDTVHKIEDKASEVKEKVEKAVDNNVFKPIQETSGSGQQLSQGQYTAQASANAQLKGPDKEKHLIDVKKKLESQSLIKGSSLKEVVTDAKAKGIIPQNEDRSALKGNHADEKSVAVEVFDKAHEISKIPIEKVMKPIDQMLGYEKDPLLRVYDNSHEILRRPLSLMSKPVESVMTGAFKTTDEAKRDNEKLLSTASEQDRREARMKEEKAKRDDRSIVGDIADKSLELATKPVELVLKPVDHLFGFDKDGKKNPMLRTLDEIYGLSKKPVDAIAKPFESLLRKMASDEHQMYQVSVRFQNDKDNDDPKLFTRLADGALNIADRVFTKPLEVVMKPLNHAFGFDEPGKKNPILEAAHSLKNATKVGVELFTKPIDRIIKEIADIGENKSDFELQSDYERQKEEATRLVAVLDKLTEYAQVPFEIVLRPVSKVLGTHKEGRKEPFLRAWDVVHQVVRTPIQVIGKPLEDAIFGERPRKNKNKSKISVNAQASSSAKVSASGGAASAKADASVSSGEISERGESRKNLFTDSIKKVERFYTKPIEVITSPIRKMILGEDNEKVGSVTEKNNREIQAKAKASSGNNQASTSASAESSFTQMKNSAKKPDKIVKTINKINNVILKPLEVMTQPISDILSHEKGTKMEKKVEVKAQAQGQSQVQAQSKSQIQVQQPLQSQTKPQPPPKEQQASASASASAQIKKN